MATSKISKPRMLGTYQTIPGYPWTAPCDGIVCVYAVPVNSNPAYLHIKLSDGRLICTNALNGYKATNETIVAKGTTISLEGYANLSNDGYLGFVPFS